MDEIAAYAALFNIFIAHIVLMTHLRKYMHVALLVLVLLAVLKIGKLENRAF